MNLEGVKVELKHGSVDCQQSQDGGVLVMVSGCMASAKSPAYRPFVQTFFLAVQSKGFYVLNDSFRYLGDDNLGLYGKAPTARLDDELDLETARRIEAAQRAAEEAEAAKRADEAEQARVAAQAAAAQVGWGGCQPRACVFLYCDAHMALLLLQLQAEREAADLAKAARDAEEAQARADAEAAAAAAAAEAAAAAAAAPAPAPAQAPPAPEVCLHTWLCVPRGWAHFHCGVVCSLAGKRPSARSTREPVLRCSCQEGARAEASLGCSARSAPRRQPPSCRLGCCRNQRRRSSRWSKQQQRWRRSIRFSRRWSWSRWRRRWCCHCTWLRWCSRRQPRAHQRWRWPS